MVNVNLEEDIDGVKMRNIHSSNVFHPVTEETSDLDMSDIELEEMLSGYLPNLWDYPRESVIEYHMM